MEGICALCTQSGKLCESHIIPEFAYEPLYDENHKLVLLSSNSAQHAKHPSQGAYEHLLCAHCETQLSRYENEAKKLWVGGKGITFTLGGKDGRLAVIHGFDYKKLKLFQLSILWRASVAKNQFFRRVSLGPHEEQIREMIHQENPGELQDYGCINYALIRNGKLANFVMGAPTASRMPIGPIQCHAYDFIFGGLHWRFLVARDNKVPKEIYQCFLQKDGTMYVQNKPFEESLINETLKKAALNEHHKQQQKQHN